MTPWHLRFSFILILLFLGLAGLARPQRLPLQRYGVEDGLPQSSVLRMLQDSRGYIWFGTQAGVCRFDGLHFTPYTRADGSGESDVLALVEDTRGTIWLSTIREGVLRFDGNSWSHVDSKLELNDGSNIRSLCPMPDGSIWLAGGRRVGHLNGDSATFFTARDGLPDAFFTSLVRGPDGSIWLGTFGAGIYRYDGVRWKPWEKPEGLSGVQINRLYRDRQGRVWAHLVDAGLFVFENSRWRSVNTPLDSRLNPISDICEDRCGRIIMVAPGGGVMILTDDSMVYYDRTAGLPTDGLSSVLADREGNLWFGATNGAYRLSGRSFLIYDEVSGLANNTVWSILQDQSGTFWFGCNQNSPVCYDGTRWTRPPGLPESLFRQAQLRCLLEDRQGRIWIGSSGGMAIYDRARRTTIIPDNGLANGYIYSFLEDREGTIWIATARGVFLYRNGAYTEAVAPPVPLQAVQAYCVFQEAGGDIWVGTANGAILIHDGKARLFTRDNGLPADRVMCIGQDEAGQVWLGTHGGGVCRWDGSSFRTYNTRSGLSNNVCYFILRDGKNLYIGTNSGINRFDGTRFSLLPTSGGLGSAESNLGAAYRDRSGMLWFGTIGGASRYDPAKEPDLDWTPPIYLTGLRLFGKSLDARNLVDLAHDQNFLTFEFTGLCFSNPRGVHYQYRIDELSPAWVETDQRSASVSWLPPGEYTFSVVAHTSDGRISAKPAKMRILIRPPFWQTVWFRGLLVVGFIGLLVVLRQYEVRRVRARTAMQEEFRLAARIQGHLLPDSFPVLDGWDIHGRSVPAREVGGDYFDVIRTGDGTLALCVADVSGKGLPASLLMANLQAAIRGQVMAGASPVECVRRANRLIVESTRSERFVTLFFCVLDPATGELSFCNAGHNPPILLRSDNSIELLEEGGTILGVFEDAEFSMQSVTLREGDILVLYSDGITESNDPSGAEFGEDRIRELAMKHRHVPAAELERLILREVERFTDPRFRPDDMTLLVVKRLASESRPAVEPSAA